MLITIIKNISFSILVLFFIAGCTETIEIDTSAVKSKIVLNGILEPDSFIKIKISKSYPLQYTDTLKYNQPVPEAIIKNAKLTLYINDENKGQMTEIGIDGDKYNTGTIFRFNYKPRIGDKIRFEVSASGFKSVWAETVIPDSIKINKLDTTTYRFTNNYYIYGYYNYSENAYYSYGNDFIVPADAKSMNLRLKIDIEKNNNIGDNYYALEIYQKFKDSYNIRYYQTHIDLTNEPIFNADAKNAIYAFFSEEGHSEYDAKIFTDNLFRNGKYTLNMSLWGYYFYKIKSYNWDGSVQVQMYNIPIDIYLHSFSKELYNYIHSQTGSSYDEIPYIFDSNTTYSNVHNGIGIVGSRTITKRIITLPPYKGRYDPENDK